MRKVGELNERIGLYSVAETNPRGSVIESRTLVATVFGKVTSQRGQESLEAARQNARETIRVLIHERDDIGVKWKLGWRGKLYNIIYLDQSNMRQGELWITAEWSGGVV